MKYRLFTLTLLVSFMSQAQVRTVENNTQSITLTPNGVTVKKGVNSEFDPNVSIGFDALKSNQLNSQIGFGNIGIGNETLRDNTLTPNGILPYGIFNTAVGHSSMSNNRGGNWNTAVGTYALSAAQQPKFNTAIGYSAGHHLGSRENVAIGIFALHSGYFGNRNTAIGAYAGENHGPTYNDTDSANVFIGYQAGSTLGAKANKLYIANTNTDEPLIWGDFFAQKLGFHGNVGIGTKSPIDMLNIHDANSSIPKSFLRFTSNYSGQDIEDGFRIGLTEFMSGIIWHYEDKPLVFGTNNTTRMTIHENGKVGIGTNNPQGNLHIYQNAGVSSIILNTSYSGPGSLDGLFIGSGQTSSSFMNRENQILFMGTNNTSIATLHPDGKFGIGLNGLPASSDLHIHKNDFVNTELQLTNTSTGYFATDGFSISMKNGGELEMNYKESQKVVFQTNTSATPELVLQTNGNMGLGVNNASAKLEVNGFTKLGTDAPAIKTKKLITTSAAMEGATINLDHLLSPNKIIAVQIMLEYIPNSYVPPSYDGNGGFWYDWYLSGDKIYIKNKVGSSGSILSKPIKIVITYEE
ncbi:MAG TPA: hypothetical protein VK175_07110 [Leadbetterella sp.]|nr:hypothetical protein [Leadbetterella sp.]